MLRAIEWYEDAKRTGQKPSVTPSAQDAPAAIPAPPREDSSLAQQQPSLNARQRYEAAGGVWEDLPSEERKRLRARHKTRLWRQRRKVKWKLEGQPPKGSKNDRVRGRRSTARSRKKKARAKARLDAHTKARKKKAERKERSQKLDLKNATFSILPCGSLTAHYVSMDTNCLKVCSPPQPLMACLFILVKFFPGLL